MLKSSHISARLALGGVGVLAGVTYTAIAYFVRGFGAIWISALVLPLTLVAMGLTIGAFMDWRYERRIARLATVMAQPGRMRLEELAGRLGLSPKELGEDLMRLISQGRYPPEALDLDLGEWVTDDASPPLPYQAMTQGYVPTKRRRPIAIYALGAAFALYALNFPLYRTMDFVLALLTALLTFVAFCLLFRPVDSLRVVNVQMPATGDELLDRFLTQSREYGGQLEAIRIRNPSLGVAVAEIRENAKRIFEVLEEKPRSIRSARQFLNYYLPTVIKLLTQYAAMEAMPQKGDNIKKAMLDIETAAPAMVDILKRELDALYQDDALDISSDIAVLRNMAALDTPDEERMK